MGMLDLIGLGCMILMFLGFCFVRTSLLIFSALCGVVVIATAATVWSRADAGTAALLVLGLALYGFGLLIVRVMLRRSVSLRLLRAYMTGVGAADIREEVSDRVEEAMRCRLIARRGEVYALTPFGEVIARVVGILYWLTGAHP